MTLDSRADDDAGTEGDDYTDRLITLERAGFKRFLPTQAPYRWNLKRLRLGRVLDVGCGIGRNLVHCQANSVGVDHNPHSVAVATSRGLTAYTSEDFFRSKDTIGVFDSLLCAHVLEHLDQKTAAELLESYVPFVRNGGSVVLITPQEAGFRTDGTHVRWVDFEGLRKSAGAVQLDVRRTYSFPFPRKVGRVFPYNEFVMVASVPIDSSG